jgi:hypothetical protein
LLRESSRKFSVFLQMAAPVGDPGEKPNRPAQLLPGREDDLELVLFCAENTLKES